MEEKRIEEEYVEVVGDDEAVINETEEDVK